MTYFLLEGKAVFGDKSIEEYKYKIKTLEAWREICALLKGQNELDML
jgi:hypothetical protein